MLPQRHAISLPSSALICLVFILMSTSNLECGAALHGVISGSSEKSGSSAGTGSSLKYLHRPLVSTLNARSSIGSVNAAPGVGVGSIDNVDLATGASSGVVNGENRIEGPASSVSGGEVVAPKIFPLSPQEPTCEQLRAMWIFSRRQSRAAEITNEIPTYRDPFAYNVWEPYYSTTRSMGGVRMMSRFGEHSRSPVFGRVISREPLIPHRITIGQQRHFGVSSTNGDVGRPVRIYGAEAKLTSARRPSQYRYIGAANGPGSPDNSDGVQIGSSALPSSNSVGGSFQKLKELIWTERAKELTQQRRAEELAARAAVLKEIANGQNIQSNYKQDSFKSESAFMDENRSPDHDSNYFMNDDRVNIINGQQTQSSTSDSKNHENKNKSNNRTTPPAARSFASGYRTKSRPGRLMLPSTISSGYVRDESRERGRNLISADSGSKVFAKSYSMRPSHFRERNRSFFKQSPLHDEYFHRDIRQNTVLNNWEAMAENFLLDQIIRNMNANMQQKYPENPDNAASRDDGKILNVEDNYNNFAHLGTSLLQEQPLEPRTRAQLSGSIYLPQQLIQPTNDLVFDYNYDGY